MKLPKTVQKQDIGLYTHEQEKYVTPFQYFAQIVVGTFIALMGGMLGYAKYQSPIRITPGLLASVALIVIGIFQAHAGTIFWYRRLRKRKPSN